MLELSGGRLAQLFDGDVLEYVGCGGDERGVALADQLVGAGGESRCGQCARWHCGGIHRFPLAALIFLSDGMIVLLIGAIVDAALVVWGWKTVRL